MKQIPGVVYGMPSCDKLWRPETGPGDCFKSLPAKPSVNYKKFLVKLFSKSFRDAAFLEKGGTQKLLLFFIKGLS
ncbi:hypothetical protein [Acetobacter musti]|uniref:hypothetical protein n=1 Tax=Acetobacter musti TaxID=864732 RepID=UPI001A7E9A61|nr:hypothetical protein [Acetobacter musti]